MSNHLPAGQRNHKGSHIPTNARIQTHNGRECYVSGLSQNNVNLKYIDNNEFKAIPWNEGRMLLPFCEEIPFTELKKPKLTKAEKMSNQLKSMI